MILWRLFLSTGDSRHYRNYVGYNARLMALVIAPKARDARG